ncbi:MAG: MFS transporter [Candidatus Korarchaeum sp.]
MSEEARRRNFIILTLTWAIMSPFSSAVNVYFSLFVLELGGTVVDLGLINLASLTTLALSRLAGGYLADAVGRKRVIVPMTMLFALSYLFFIIAPDWRFLLIGSVINSLALMYQPALMALVGDILPEGRRGSSISIMNAPSQLLNLAGPPLATLTVSALGLERGMRAIFTLVMISTLISGILRIFLIETRNVKIKPSFSQALIDYKDTLRAFRGDLGKLIMITSSVAGVYNMAYPYVQVYAVKYLDLSLEFWGWLSTLVAFLSTISLVVSGALSDRIGRNLMMALGYGSGLAGLLMIALAPRGDPLYFTVAMMVNAMFSSYPPAQAMLVDLTDEEVRGKVNAISGLLEGALAGPMSALGGLLYTVLGPYLFLIASLSLLPMVVGAVGLSGGKRA